MDDIICLFYRFNKLTERFFKNNPWPEAESVSGVIGDGNKLVECFLDTPHNSKNPPKYFYIRTLLDKVV